MVSQGRMSILYVDINKSREIVKKKDALCIKCESFSISHSIREKNTEVNIQRKAFLRLVDSIQTTSLYF